MKRLISLLLLLALCGSLSSCTHKEAASTAQEPERISIYATFYPIYALTEMITKDVPDVSLYCLVQPQDGCLRDYRLSDWDLALLARSADAVIAGGRGLESFESSLTNLGESGPAVSSLMVNMELEKVTAVNVNEDSDSHWSDSNPFIYMDVDGAIELCQRIAAHMGTLDPKYQAQYNENYESARARLETLKSDMLASAGDCAGTQVIVMNEALVYTAKMFDLHVQMCYARESGEDITGEDLNNCLETLAGCEARLILIEKQAPIALCTALEEAGYQLVKLDILSTGKASDGSDGYFNAQLTNAKAIGTAVQSLTGV